MKKYINISFLLVLTMFMVSCQEEEIEDFKGPYSYTILGPSSVKPNSEVTYTLPELQNDDTFTWAVEGAGASIVGDASGRSVTVSFGAVGSVVITFTNDNNTSGRKAVTVAEVAPSVTAELRNNGALMSGASDTVFFDFASPLVGEPTLDLYTDSSEFNKGNPFVSGTLGDLQQKDNGQYYAIYTAGDGNGVSEALFQDIKTTEDFGGENIDSAFVQLYRVDNVAPLASIEYSDEVVNDSTVVTVTVTFTEQVSFDFTSAPVDSAMYISFSGADVEAEKDTLQPTDDPLVYTYEYTVNGEGNGEVMVALENVVDLAGHPVSAVSNTSFTVDNTDPVIITAVAMQNEGYISVEMTASESATGWYTILPDGADAPESAADFSSSGVAVSTLTPGTWTLPVMEDGEYDVYFIAADAAGNYSDIQMAELTVD